MVAAVNKVVLAFWDLCSGSCVVYRKRSSEARQAGQSRAAGRKVQKRRGEEARVVALVSLLIAVAVTVTVAAVINEARLGGGVGGCGC